MPTNLLDENGLIKLDAGNSVELKPYVDRPLILRQYMTDAEIQQHTGSDLMLDVECYSNYFCCGFKHPSSNLFIRIESGPNKSFNPRFLSWLLSSYRTIGFNSRKYDLPMLWAAFHHQNPAYLKEVSNSLIFSEEMIDIREIQKKFGFEIFKINHIDLISVCPLKGSLKLYGARIHCPRIQDLPIPDTANLTEKEINIVNNYNCNDLDVTHSLFDFMKERLSLRSDMSARYNEDLMSKSDAQIAEVIIAKEVAKINKKFPPKHEVTPGTIYKYDKPSYIQYATPELQKLLDDVLASDFRVNENGNIDKPPALENRIVRVGDLNFTFGIGGLHSCEKSISFRSSDTYIIVDRDVISYYPDIILTLGLFPEGLGPAFTGVFRGFKDERIVAKQAKNFTYDKGLKILINGTSGKLNSKYSRLYSPKSYIQMTLTGQLSILMLTEMLVCNGFKVISGNTDGIVIYAEKNRYDELVKWIEYWEKETQYKTEETQYKAYYARDVNAYFALKLDGTTKVKGSYSEVGSQSGTQLDNNPITLICSDAIKEFLSKGTDIAKTIKECKDIRRFVTVRNVKGGAAFKGEYLGRVVRWIYSKGSQDCIQYTMTGNKVADTDGCRPLMDLPETFPIDIDYENYIKRTIDMLYDIDYYQRPKQMTFF